MADLNIGVHHMWGFSPAMNLYETPQLYNQFPLQHEDEPYNILLVEPGDIRHILKTISERRRLHGNQAIHFYIYDKPIEVITKDLLMMQIATDWSMPIRTRINTWLEVYGNILLQERTESYVYQQSKSLINLLCNNQGFLNDIVDFSCLKYKEKDEIEEVLKSYDSRIPCDIERLYDDRLRHSYRDRYDNRTNLIDWDYNMNGVHDTAGIIHKKLYKTWRTTGIGFEFGDQVYNKPNRTMISYCEGHERGKALLRRGLWTDITISPYITFGIDCYKSNNYAKDLFLVLNKGTGAEQWRHNCCEVSVYNLLCYFTEIETGRIYKMRKEHDIFSGLNDDEKNEEPKDMREDKSTPTPPSASKDTPELPKENINKLNTIKEEEENTETKEEEEEDLLKEKEKRAEMTALEIIQSFDNIKVFFITGDFNNMYKKKRFNHLFHRVVFSNVSVHLLDNPEIVNLLKPDCCVTLESVRHMTILKPEQKIEYLKRVNGMAEKIGLKCCIDLTNKEKMKETVLDLENASYIKESKKIEDKIE